jgi:hypothetical protein
MRARLSARRQRRHLPSTAATLRVWLLLLQIWVMLVLELL